MQEECPIRHQPEPANQLSLLSRSQSNKNEVKANMGTDTNTSPSSEKEKFSWTEQEVSDIMGAFYYGYMFTQIIGGTFDINYFPSIV